MMGNVSMEQMEARRLMTLMPAGPATVVATDAYQVIGTAIALSLVLGRQASRAALSAQVSVIVQAVGWLFLAMMTRCASIRRCRTGRKATTASRISSETCLR